MSEQLPAAAQIEKMREAIKSDEEELIEVAPDGERYAQVLARRAARLREIERLGFVAQLEKREDAARHQQALRDRVADARSRYGALRGEAAEVERELAEMADRLESILPRCNAIQREMRACSAREENALAALRKLGQPPENLTIGQPPCPSEQTAVRWWKMTHELLAAGGFNPQRAAFAQSGKR